MRKISFKTDHSIGYNLINLQNDMYEIDWDRRLNGHDYVHPFPSVIESFNISFTVFRCSTTIVTGISQHMHLVTGTRATGVDGILQDKTTGGEGK